MMMTTQTRLPHRSYRRGAVAALAVLLGGAAMVANAAESAAEAKAASVPAAAPAPSAPASQVAFPAMSQAALLEHQIYALRELIYSSSCSFQPPTTVAVPSRGIARASARRELAGSSRGPRARPGRRVTRLLAALPLSPGWSGTESACAATRTRRTRHTDHQATLSGLAGTGVRPRSVPSVASLDSTIGSIHLWSRKTLYGQDRMRGRAEERPVNGQANARWPVFVQRGVGIACAPTVIEPGAAGPEANSSRRGVRAAAGAAARAVRRSRCAARAPRCGGRPRCAHAPLPPRRLSPPCRRQ